MFASMVSALASFRVPSSLLILDLQPQCQIFFKDHFFRGSDVRLKLCRSTPQTCSLPPEQNPVIEDNEMSGVGKIR